MKKGPRPEPRALDSSINSRLRLADEAASEEAERDREDDGDQAGEEEGVVEHELADAGRARVVHLDGAEEGRVGREDEQSRNGSERSHEHVGVTGVGGGDTESGNDGRGNRLSGGSLRVQEHRSEEEHDGEQGRGFRNRTGGEFLNFVRVTGHERVAQPSHTEHADDGDHTALEDGRVSDLADFDVAGHRDEHTDDEHEAHDGGVTADDDVFNQANSRRNGGGIEHHEDNADEEDENGALGKRLEFRVGGAGGSLDEALGEAFLVDRVLAEVHLGDERHDEGGQHAGDERRRHPDAEQSRVGPAEVFKHAGHVDHGGGNRRSRNGDLRSDHGDRQRHARTNVLFLGDFDDNRDHREGRVARTGEDREDIGHDRGEVVDVLRIGTKDAFGNLNEVIKTAGELHRRNGRDHRGDDQDNVPGDVTRLHTKAKAENEHTGTTGVADADAAKADAQENRAEQHDNLKNKHDIHGCLQALSYPTKIPAILSNDDPALRRRWLRVLSPVRKAALLAWGLS